MRKSSKQKMYDEIKPKYNVWQFVSKAISFTFGTLLILLVFTAETMLLFFPDEGMDHIGRWFLVIIVFPITGYAGYVLISGSKHE